MVEVEGRQLIINNLPHLAWHLQGILEKVRFCLAEHRKMMR
jgi:hypothetical protein